MKNFDLYSGIQNLVSETKPKGGARPNAGRKKNEVKAAVEAAGIDGRSVGGKDHAGWLIEQMNAIDPEMMQDLDRIVSSEPFKAPKPREGVSKDEQEKIERECEKLEAARREHWKLKQIALKRWRKFSFEVRGWARLWFADRTALDVRKYLYDKAGHQAVKIINHVHDKPIEHNHTHTISERFRIAMEKAEQRVRDGR